MIKNKRHSLPGIIGDDLLLHKKILLMLFAVIISAILVITTVYKTRLLITKREHLILEHNILNVEWRNLILEENALGDHSRIERIAIEKLQMRHIDPIQENILVQS